MGSVEELTRPMFCDMVGLGVTEAFAELELNSEDSVAQQDPQCFCGTSFFKMMGSR